MTVVSEWNRKLLLCSREVNHFKSICLRCFLSAPCPGECFWQNYNRLDMVAQVEYFVKFPLPWSLSMWHFHLNCIWMHNEDVGFNMETCCMQDCHRLSLPGSIQPISSWDWNNQWDILIRSASAFSIQTAACPLMQLLLRIFTPTLRTSVEKVFGTRTCPAYWVNVFFSWGILWQSVFTPYFIYCG